MLTGTSPYDGIEVAITVEEQHLGVAGYSKDEPIVHAGRGHGKGERPRLGRDVCRLPRHVEPNVWMIFPTRSSGRSTASRLPI